MSWAVNNASDLRKYQNDTLREEKFPVAWSFSDAQMNVKLRDETRSWKAELNDVVFA